MDRRFKMGRFWFSFLSGFIFLLLGSGCSSLQVQREVLSDNTFVANDPKISIAVNPELQYIGNPNQQGVSESTSGYKLKASSDNYCFVKHAENKVQIALTIQIRKTEGRFVSNVFRNTKNTIEKGVTESGGKEFQYYAKEVYPSLKSELVQFIADQGYTMGRGLSKVYGRIYGSRDNTLVKILYYEDIGHFKSPRKNSWKNLQTYTEAQYKFWIGFNERGDSAFHILE